MGRSGSAGARARERGPTRTLTGTSALSSPATHRSDSGLALALACWLQSLCPLPAGGPQCRCLALGSHSGRKKAGAGRAALAVQSPVALSQSVAALQLECFLLRTFVFGGSGNGNCLGRRPGLGGTPTSATANVCVALSRFFLCKCRGEAVKSNHAPRRARLEARCSAQQHGPIRRRSPRQPWDSPRGTAIPQIERN